MNGWSGQSKHDNILKLVTWKPESIKDIQASGQERINNLQVVEDWYGENNFLWLKYMFEKPIQTECLLSPFYEVQVVWKRFLFIAYGLCWRRKIVLLLFRYVISHIWEF